MDTIKFTCNVDVTNATDKPLTVKLVLNDEILDSVSVSESSQLMCDIPDVEDMEHKLELQIEGKTNSHTVLDDNGNVLSSTQLVFSDFKIDDIDIDSIILTNSLPYTHNFNGTGETVTEKFYNTAGCNGTITLEFTTPFYLWLLENM